MKRNSRHFTALAAVFTTLLLGAVVGDAAAGSAIIGLDHTDQVASPVAIDLTARCDFISTADGNSILIWGYSQGTPAEPFRAQYPGPTLIVDEGDTVTITLHNHITDETGALLPENTSLTVHGFSVAASGGVPGALTREAEPGGSVTYSFVADRPGTYLYESATEPWLQVEMGLLGALIVRPTGMAQLPGPNDAEGYATSVGYAYDDESTAFHREYLFLLTEMDPMVHDMVQFGQKDQIANHEYFAVYWFINGRVGPDTLAEDNVFYLPTQPYSIVPRMLPGEKLLMRVIGGSRDMHPYHHHGNHARIVARDGQLLSSGGPGTGVDLSYEVFTVQSVPGETVDAIFEWTGKNLGWDMYGHADGAGCNDLDSDGYADPGNPGSARPWEWCADHGKPLPVVLPENQNLTFGGFWSGSPFLGAGGGLPPGEGGLNPYSGFFFMWHSHTEKELTNFDIFPGGMMTMLAVEPPGTTDLP